MTTLRYLRAPAPARGPLNNTVQSIRAVYRTDPAVCRALLPQPLAPLADPNIFLQFAHVAMHVSKERTVEIGALTMGVQCTYEGTPGAYCFHMAMEGETVVTSGRERYGEPKKIAETTFAHDGNHVKATVTRHGITYFTIEGTIGAENDRPRNFEEYIYCYKALMGIEDPATFDGDAYLTRLNWVRNYTDRRGMEGKITLRESPYDPLVDIPVREIVDMEYVEGASQTSGEILRTVPGEWISAHWAGRFDDPTNPGVDVARVKELAA